MHVDKYTQEIKINISSKINKEAGFAVSLVGGSGSLTRFLKSAATSRVNTARFRKPVDSSWLFWDR